MFRKRGALLLVLVMFILINIHSINSGYCPGYCGCYDGQYCLAYDSYYYYGCGGIGASCGDDGCSGGLYVDYYCSSGYCYYQYLERDSSSTYCNCLGTGLWNLGGEIAASNCCGDDAGEYKIIETSGTDAPSPYNDNTGTTCCNPSTDCTESGTDTCTATGSAAGTIPNKAYCGASNTWYGGDASSNACGAIVGANSWSLGREIATTTCCGDDNGEYKITQGVGQPACCSQGGANVCVTSSRKCRDQYGKEITCYDGLDNDCDGNPDCTDDNCKTGTEDCADNTDNDCDGYVDCSDEDCKNKIDCIGCEPENTEIKCEDKLDNDCDNHVDCEKDNTDKDCIIIGLCSGCEPENTEIKCEDKLDNDCDGRIDCGDTDCYDYPSCECNIGHDDCCSDIADGSCDIDCTEETDTSCKDKCTTAPNDCCVPSKDSVCDSDCLLGQDPDCQTNCQVTSDDCCSDLADGNCDIDCTGETDSDCTGKCTYFADDCCNPSEDKRCDLDCLPGQDPNCNACMAENSVSNNCDDTKDNDCDGFVDHEDNNCPGCGRGTKLCNDGGCREVCEPVKPRSCISEKNGICEEGEGCECDDCSGKRDSCARELVCDPVTKLCSCPAGTSLCSDGKCRLKCFICGNGILEEGEECDGSVFGGLDQCTEIDFLFTEGVLSCSISCLLDTSGCTLNTQDSDSDGIPDWWEIQNGLNPNDPSDALEDPDGDGLNNWEEYLRGTNPFNPDTDGDGLNDRDDPCPLDYSNQCPAASEDPVDTDGDGIPDWWEIQNGLNPNDPSDALEDPDGDGLNNWEEYLRGTNPFNPDTDGDGLNDKIDPYPLNPTNTNNNLCGNSIIDSGETCDGANLGVETCADMFGSGYGGVLTCFNTDDGEKSCHLDTSGCFKTPLVCTGQKPCSSDKNCGCSECVGEQSSCNYGSVCDTTSKCACIEGTTLCKDSTCRTPQSCKDLDGGEQSCIIQNNVCDPGEGCGCPDCKDKKGPCNALSICKNGVCTGCFLKRAYWADVKTGEEEDCIGSGNEIKMTAEGTPGCKDKTIMFKLKEPPTDIGDAVFKNSKAELVWKAEPEGYYEFIASLKGDSDEITRSTKLEVEYCIRECDVDCDQYCETESCVNDNPSYCKNMIEEGIIVLDANALSPWCEDCDPYGSSKGQETCAAYYDCTPGWWGSTTPQGWDEQMKQDAMNYLEWGDCGESKGATGTGRQQATGSMRNRLVCPPGLPLSIGECCAEQSKCYCKLPDFSNPKVKKLNCNLPQFRPTEIKGCLAEEKFPFFTNTNILIVVLILVSFYIWKNREKAKTKK